MRDTTDSPSPDDILLSREVAAKVRCHVKHWLRLVRSGDAPPPITLGSSKSGKYKKYGWRYRVIEAWLQDRQRAA